ncbi:MAG TPA: hypothetical protein PKK43_03455 [Spirochaetota bacterium]|nr:hypothetical protein [Spirochaetota bacterium]
MNKNFSTDVLINTNDYALYREYWENTKDIISSVSNRMESRLIELEKQSLQFDRVYHEIESALSTLSSLYAKTGTTAAQDFLLKMRAHVREHRSQIGKQKVAFNVIHFLHDKIRTYEESRFSSFPDIESDSHIESVSFTRCSYHNENYPYKWFSFHRNGSWFLTRYESLNLVPYRIVPYSCNNSDSRNIIEYNDEKYSVIDLFSKSNGIQSPDPSFYAIIKHKSKAYCFAADRKGKRILARKDFISQKITPFSEHVSKADGFVSLAGARFIHLNLTGL